MSIHPLACVDADAVLGRDVHIGPFCVVERGVTIGNGCRLAANVVIKEGTTLGDDCQVFEGAVLGGTPQHVHPPENPGRVRIGRGNVIREHVTIHRAMDVAGETVVGDHNLLMACSHVAHDCRIGNHVILANNVMLAGHVTVEDRAFLSGAVGVHQFCRIGKLAMVGGQAHVVKDIPPFVTVDGVTTLIVGLNRVGLRRAGFSPTDMRQLKAAYQLIYRSGLPWSRVLERLAVEFDRGPAAAFAEFFRGGTRGFTPARLAPATTTLALHDEDQDASELARKAG